ncbi:autotransporter-associated beta strand repeat-containing protein [Mesorhizobium sp. BAC0120]|uniref:autotransporter-associated beta strand repeat-containing protein n=1 Tax=Mesorhizobium sp. BAC0120 TaxID=3090670 RepID=UPI00298C041F|nr:autotransporter-associated beta strand repeat-containing protein [Mesorhizobium sp. BAC0120]MDW6023142.1 autotransporter-associated beta strand repeat-containing protein [Mesorhizobium sp. BAC0120]
MSAGTKFLARTHRFAQRPAIASTALLLVSVAPLALVAATATALAQSTGQTGGTGGNAPNYNTPGTSGGGGVSGNGVVTGSAGGSGVTWVQFTYTGGTGGGSDSGGSGGGGYILGAGGGGGGGGGAGLAISASGSITSNVLGGTGGAGGNGWGETQGGYRVGGGGGGGGGGSGILVNNATGDVTITIGSGVSVKGGLGGEGGDANTSWSYGVNALDNGAGGNGGNGVTANSSTNTTIVNSGIIQGGNGGLGGKFVMSDPSVHGTYGQGGYGILGSNITIVNNAGATISGGTGTGYGARQAIYITGGANEFRNEGSINGKIELAGGTTDVFGTYSNVLQVNGGATVTISAGDATGFSTITNAGVINVGDGNTLSSGTISNAGGATINLGIGAVLFGTGNTLNNDATVNVGTDGVVMDNGDINNNASGIINFNGPGGTAILSPGAGYSVNNSGQIKVLGGDVDVQMSNINNQGNGSVSLTGGDMFGVSTFTNSDTATLNVSAGRKLSVQILNFNGGTITGTGTIEAANAINLWGNGTVGATLAGSAGLTRGGPGTTVLTGNHTYTGGTTVNAGVLQLGTAGVAGSIRGQVTVKGAGTLTVTNANTAGITGIANAGTMNFQNATNAGSATITNSGELYFYDTSSAGSAVVTNNNFLEFHNASSAGSGKLTNNGTLLFYDNSLAGTATIANTSSALLNFQNGSSADNARITNDGMLSFYDTSTAGSATIINNDELTFYDASGAGSATISNNGSLTFRSTSTAGTATITTSANATTRFLHNSSGGDARFITETGGAVDISGLTTTGATAGSIEGAGTYLLGSKTLTVGSNNRSTTVNGAIADGGAGGSLVKVGAGTLTLSGTATYTGATTVSGGTLAGGAANALSAASAFTVDATLDLGGFSQTIASLSGTGTVTNSGTDDATLTAGDNMSTIFSGTLEDGPDATTALIKVGAGTLTLMGANTFTGGTTISGGTLQLGDGGSLVGEIVNNASLAFNRSDAYTFGGKIEGAGTIKQTGTGTLTLSGTNAYTGATLVSGGTLAGGAANAFSSASAFTVDATLDLGGFDQTIASLSGTGTVTNSGTANAMLTAGDTTATTFSGTIKDGSTSTTALTKTGTGTLTLTGSSAYTGGTKISHGTLQLGDGGSAGAIVGEVTVGAGGIFRVANADTTGTSISNDGYTNFVNGTTAGSADITNNVGNNVILRFSNSSSAGSAVITNNSWLDFRDDSTAGDAAITNNSYLLFYDNSTAGNANITNDAQLAFSNGSTADSATIVNHDVVSFADDSTAANATITTEAGGITWFGNSSSGGDARFITGAGGKFDISSLASAGTTAGSIEGAGSYFLGSKQLAVGGNNLDTAVSGVISDCGPSGHDCWVGVGNGGSLVKTGTGTLTLAGANTYTGGTTILNGTLEIGGTSGSILGDVLNDAALAFNRSNAYQFDGAISGTGDVEQRGGTTILTGTSTYTGETKVSGGKLLVNGSIASSSGITVDAGATIGGSGTLADTVVNGTLSAGNSPGTLTVDGDLTLGATSVSLFELGASGVEGGASNDLVNVSGNLVLGGTLQTPGAVSGYYRLFNVDGTISGSYASVPTDASVQTAIPHQVNLLITNGGQFVQFWDGADGIGNGSVDGGDGTWGAAGTNWTGAPGSANFNDQWHSAVGVFAGTAGTVTVSGPVAFEGVQFSSTGYTIAGGVLAMTGDSAGNAAASFVNVDGGVTAEIASVLTGAAGIGLDKVGGGTLILSGINTYTGATTIEGGTLAMSGSGSIAASSVVAVNGGTFDISGVTTGGLTWITSLAGTSTGTVLLGSNGLGITNGSTEFAGVIAGGGQIDISGTQTLSGVNTYTGTTGVSGTLALKGDGSIANSSYVMVSGTFDISQTTDGTSVRQLFGPSGYGVVALGSKTLTITDAGSSWNTFIGSIRDGGIGGGTAGSLVIASGASQYLSGTSTYTGSTTIEQGGRLWLVNNGSLSPSSSLVVDGVFDTTGSWAPQTFKSLSGSGEIYFGSTLRITDAAGTFSGVISGGNLVLDGGTLTLSGVNTYTGGTTVGGFIAGPVATLVAANNDAVGTGSVLLNPYGVFKAGANGLAFANRFEVSSSFGTVDTNGYTMTIAGVIADATDPGTLHKTGAGTLVLTGANSYGDGTVIEAGTLKIGNGGTTGSILGDVAAAGTLAFDRSDTYTFAGIVSDAGVGHGQVAQDGSGVLALTGANTYSGGTFFNDGVIAVASDDNLGDAVGGLTFNGGTLRFDAAFNLAATRAVKLDAGGGSFDSNGFDVAAASDITGSGGLTKAGAGELVLAGHNSYTGPTTVSQGTLGAGSAGAFSPNSAVSVAGGATLDLGGFDQTIGALSGSGSILLGAGGLTVDQDGDSIFGGAISGAGSLSKEGAGKLLLSGTSTYTGQTFVKAGILSVNGDISSSSLLTVDAGATLGGSGLLPSVIVNHDGRLSPGNSIGTVSIAGNLTFGAGSTYAVETSTTAADRTNVSGTANLSGGTVVVTYAPGSYVAKSYTILNAAGGLGGTEFRDLDAKILPGLETSLTYDGNNVYLTTKVRRTDPGCTRDCEPDFGNLNRNQRSVANAIVSYFDVNGSIPAEFATLDANGLTVASGEIAAGAITAGIDSSDHFLGLISDQALAGSGGAFGSMAAGPAAYAEKDKTAGDSEFAALGLDASHSADAVARVFESRWQSWGAAYGGALSVGGDAATGSHDTDADTFGLVGGISRHWGGTFLGLALGGGSSNFSLSDGLGSGHAGTFNAGIFARQELGQAYVAGAAAYGFHDVETSRTVFGDALSGDFTAHSFAGRIEAGYGIAAPLATVTPYAAFQAIAYRLPGYTETGAGSFALAYEGDTVTATRTELGARLDGTLLLSDGAVLTLSGRAALAINGGDDIAFTAGFQRLPGTGFVIEGAEPDRYSALVDAGAEYKAQSGFFAALALQGEFSGNVQSLSGKAKIGFNW